jgi:GNAT superfamily N-acetyltransferase
LNATTPNSRTAADLAIVDLRARPELIDRAVEWHYDGWGVAARRTREEIRGFYRASLDERPIPATLIALRHGTPAGMASLRAIDLFYPASAHLSPWLDSLYVDRDYRGLGIGSALCEAVAALARELGHDALYLGTPDQQRLYERLGWRWIADDAGLGHAMSSIMARRLDPGA